MMRFIQAPARRLCIQLLLVFALCWAGGNAAVNAAVLTVTNTNSSGAGSFPQAVSSAGSGDTITFDPSVSGTITLASEIAFGKDLTIQGPSAAAVTLQAASGSRILNIASGTVLISNLTFSGGAVSGGYGGAIYTSGTLTLTDCTISGNSAARGGGIYNDSSGILTLTNCTLTGNSGVNDSGSIFSLNSLTLNSCTVSGNSSSAYGGIYMGGSATLTSCIVALNSGGDLGGTFTSGGSNLVGDTNPTGISDGFNHDRTGLTSAALKLGALASNGGPTSTMMPQATSPAVAGDYSSATTTDQRGQTRSAGHHTIGAVDYAAAAPAPVADTYSINQGQTLNIAAPGLLANDTDPQAEALTAAAASTPAHGTVTVTDDGSFSYTPAAGYLGADSFRYTAINASGVSASAAVALTVTLPLTRYVSPTGSDSSDGTQAHALLTIQAAINASQSGDTVIVEDGTYTGTGNRDLDFGGRSITVRGHHGAVSTIIDCGGSSSDNHIGFVFQNGETNAVVRGLTIQNGYSSFSGGGIANVNSTVLVTGCILAANTCTDSYISGGAVYNGGTMTLINCALTGNTAPGGYGGGVENTGTATLINCTLTGNTAPGGYGGGIDNYGTGITLTNTILWADTADSNSEISDINSTLTASYCDIAQTSGVYSGSGNINADPMFISATDLRLQAGSPCLAAGTSANAPTTDLNAAARTNPPAVGAYERPAAAALQFLTITPNPVTVNIAAAHQMTATATYADDTTQDVTAQVTWSSLNPSAATVSAQGIVTGNTPGVTDIIAALASQTALATIIVHDPGAATNYHALWTSTSGAFSVWDVAMGGADTPHNFDALPGCTAVALATTPDDHVHVLLNADDGSIRLGDATSAAQSGSSYAAAPSYGPFADWTAQALAAGTDGNLRVLWSRPSGQMSLWNLPPNGSYDHAEYGPFGSWRAQFVATAPDNTVRVLWTDPSGTISLWVMDTLGGYQHFEYGPFPGWAPKSLTTSPNGLMEILWNHASDNQMSLWLVNDRGYWLHGEAGPYGTWAANALTAGADGLLHIGWSEPDGTASLWDLPDMTGVSYTYSVYGASSGWSLKALSAVP